MLKNAFNALRKMIGIFIPIVRAIPPASKFPDYSVLHDSFPLVVLSLHNEQGKRVGAMRISKKQLPAAAVPDVDIRASRFNDPAGLCGVFRITVGEPVRTETKFVCEDQYEALLADGTIGRVTHVESNSQTTDTNNVAVASRKPRL
ncbi:hypothetical protein ACFW0H_14990 [Pseudomonas sp. CR3202]|uniref:hypothetical protein n=1 Tax=Pseudomonas sp. CR3202 TaxID=3351532 RepID=UPI003BEF509E